MWMESAILERFWELTPELQQSVPATELLQAVRATAMGCQAPPQNEQARDVFQEKWQA